MNTSLEWWLNYCPLDEIESSTLFRKCPTLWRNCPVDDWEYDALITQYFNRMPNCHLSTKTHTITFADRATTLINSLFETYVDNDTLVISTRCEHDSVRNNLLKCSHTYLLDFYKEIRGLDLYNLKKELKKYNKVFVYVIGTQISTGEITPQEFMIELKSLLSDKQSTIVLDDVHGMFITPRDYSIYDYVISTAHALVRDFDMGILVSRIDNTLSDSIKAYVGAKYYLESLDIILKRSNKLRMFSTCMQEYFYHELLEPNKFSLLERTTPNIFSIKLNGFYFTDSMVDELFKYEIKVEQSKDEIKLDSTASNTNSIYIRFRAQQFIKNPEFLTEGIKVLKSFLESSYIGEI